MHPASDTARTLDIMRQGFAKRQATRPTSRVRVIRAALAGKSGYQSPWALAQLREELASLIGKAQP